MRTGGRILVDELELNGADLGSACAGRATCRCSTRSTTRRPSDHVPPRTGRGHAAEANGNLRAGRVSASSRAGGGHAGGRWCAHGEAGLVAVLLLVGEVARVSRPRAWQELDYADVSRDREGGLGSTSRTDPGAHGRGVFDLRLREPRPGRTVAPRGRAHRGGRRRGRGARRGRVGRAAPEGLERLRELLVAAEDRWSLSARVAGPRRRAGTWGLLRDERAPG